ncbi:MAG: hypothetical protein K9N21_09695 [Deltaproteobacteria bacterium]|nr:hypothetical protein [Deltaproteobacteria bacterium]
MKIASLVKSLILSGNEKSLPEQGELRVGDRLVGKVLELKGAGKAFMDFGRFRAMAEVRFPVKLGEEIHVKVMHKGASLRLGLCGPGPGISEPAKKNFILGEFPSRHLLKEFQSQIRDLLPTAGPEKPGHSELGNAVRALMFHFEPMDMGKDVPRIAAQLKKFIEDTGIFYEKKLEKIIEPFIQGKSEIPARESSEISGIKHVINKDLKANLLVLREFLDGKDPALKILDMKDPEGLRKTVGKLLTEITVQQHDTGTRSMRSEAVQVYTYLLPMKELEKDGKIKVYYSKKKRSTEGEGYRVSLLLDMEKIGRIRSDLFLNGRSLTIEFSVSEFPIKEIVDGHVDGLKTILGDIFKSVAVNVVVSEKKISEFEFEDLPPESTGLIDLKV